FTRTKSSMRLPSACGERTGRDIRGERDEPSQAARAHVGAPCPVRRERRHEERDRSAPARTSNDEPRDDEHVHRQEGAEGEEDGGEEGKVTSAHCPSPPSTEGAAGAPGTINRGAAIVSPRVSTQIPSAKRSVPSGLRSVVHGAKNTPSGT